MCVCARVECVLVNVLYVSTEQLPGTSLVHNKAIHLVHDSFNRHVPLMLCYGRKCSIAGEI